MNIINTRIFFGNPIAPRIFIGATLAKEMRNCMILSSLIFCLIIEFFYPITLDLKTLYSCFLLFLILRGVFLTMYLNRVFKLVRS
jgi:Na+-driven multidrug efflux pump